MNAVFLAIILIAFATTAVRELSGVVGADGKTPMAALTDAVIQSAAASVTLAIGLIGVMAFFLGVMKVAEAGGLLTTIARLVRPLMVRLFPEVPAEHPAMGAMVLNISANALGLGNAATPFGIRAMQALDTLNAQRGTASNAMVLFLAINTSSVTLLPTGVIALRAAVGSKDPAAIVPTTLIATIASTIFAITLAKTLQRFWTVPVGGPVEPQVKELQSEGGTGTEGEPSLGPDDPGPEIAAPDAAAIEKRYPLWVSLTVLAAVLALIPLTLLYGRDIAPWIVPLIIVSLLLYGAAKRVRVYEAFVEGARDGFQVAVRIIPYLVAILVAVGMFRASGALGFLVGAIEPVSAPLGLPGDAVPMALLRPLSGSGAYGVMASILRDPAIGPDSYTGYLVSTIMGSTETTFYVLAVYFGAVQVRRVRHALVTGLSADVAGIAAAVVICSMLFL